MNADVKKSRWIGRAMFLAACLLLCTGGTYAQATITVNSTAQEATQANPNGIVNGNCTLGEAIIAANTNTAVDACSAGQSGGTDTIVLPAGIYLFVNKHHDGANFGSPHGLPDVVTNITIQGAGASQTILEHSATAISFCLVFLDNPAATLTLQDLTVRGFPGNTSTALDGGLKNNGHLILQNMIYENGIAPPGRPTGVTNAFCNNNTILTVQNSLFRNISSTVPGSAINVCGRVIIANSSFFNNVNTVTGGGPLAFSVNGDLTIQNSLFVGNSVLPPFGGGAILITNSNSGSATISNSVFSGNSGGDFSNGDGGAILHNANIPLTILNSTFINNLSRHAGALMHNSPASLTIVNSTFAGNSAVEGSAIANTSSTAIINFSNVTIVRNTALSRAAFNFNGFPNIRNSIIASNTPTNFNSPFGGVPGAHELISGGHNIFGETDRTIYTAGPGDQVGTLASPLDPLVGGLASNSSTVMAGANLPGVTSPQVVQTMPLLIGSPALNLGAPGTPDGISPNCEATDQRGIARPQPGGGRCDVGAVEDLTGNGIPASSDLSLTVSGAPNPVNSGATLTYTIVVTNNGPDPTANVVVTDVLPAGVTFSSASASCTNSSGTVTCNLGTMSPGATVTITIAVTATGAGQVDNSPSVTGTSADPNNTNNSATSSVTIAAQDADLNISKSDSPDPVNVNANLTYTITVNNTGPANATNVSMTDALPAGVTFQSLTSPAGWTCTTPAVGASGTVTCTNPSLAASGQAVFTLVVVPGVGAAGNISNTATVTATENDPVTADNSATASTQVNPVADLAVTKTDSPDPVNANSNLTYTISVTNNGPSAASTVALNDPLPAGVTFQSMTPPAGWTCTNPAVGSAGVVNCTIASLAVGGPFAFTLVVRPTAAGNIRNTATISTSTTDPTAGNNSDTATTVVNLPQATDFQLAISPSSLSVPRGQIGTFTLTVTPVPAGASFTSAITFTTVGVPPLVLPEFSQNPVTPGPNVATVTLRVRIQSNAGLGPLHAPPLPPQMLLVATLLAMLSGLAWLTLRRPHVPRTRLATAALVLWMVALASLSTACGGTIGRFRGPVQFTVTATSGALTHSSTITVTIP
jgi:uncharacterized repeat protein (TIGR01451 family)